MNDLYLTDEEIHGKEPTWEKQEIERLKEENSKLKLKIEELEQDIRMMNGEVL
jgi:predicted RNase H-like nuclease (RuvC/YqgF family)